MYSLGVVSEMTGIPVSTLKYYDREGLFGDLHRDMGIRMFGDREIETLRVIELLESSGLGIEEIRNFLRTEVSSEDKLKSFQAQRRDVEERIRALERILDMLNYKCWFYEQAVKEGSEEAAEALVPDRLPPEIRKMFDRAFGTVRQSAGGEAESITPA